MVFQKKCVADSYDICCTNLDPTQMSGLNSGSLQIGDGESSSRSPGVWWGGGRYGCVFFVPTCVKEEYLVWSWICGPGLVFFLVKTVCVGDSSMVGVSSFLEAEETMQHVRGVVLAATIMAALQVTVIAWYEIVVSFVFYIRMHALSCLVVESDCVSDN